MINITDFEIRTIQHGEIILFPVSAINGSPVQTARETVVAHSETGHHHSVIGKSTIFDPLSSGIEYERLCKEIWGDDEKNRVYWPKEITPFRVDKDSKLEHKKSFDQHQTFDVVKGDYVILTKTEYDPFADVLRSVRD